MIYIFDIDGTICDISHRLHFIQQKPADWHSFFAACGYDEPIDDVVSLLRFLHTGGHFIALITGRSDECRKQTLEWLERYVVNFDALYMRREGDHRQDSVVKSELLDRLIADHPAGFIAGVFEDRKQVVDMYRARGLRVYQVADGDF